MNNKKYAHIKKAERLEIAILLGKGYSYRNIAKVQGRSVSSISEEVRNNSVKGKYSKYQGVKVASDNDLWNYISKKRLNIY
jgi:IS30 family transposase